MSTVNFHAMKRIVLLVFCLFSTHIVVSQSFMQTFGINGFMDRYQSKTTISSGLAYTVRYNFMEKEKMSISVGLPMSLGGVAKDGEYGGYYYDASYLKNFRFMIDIPLVVNFNFAGLSTPDNKQLFGGFVGGGIGYHFGPVTKEKIDSYGYLNYDETTQSAAGPVLNGGFRLRFGKNDNNYIEARGSYMKSFLKHDADVIGIQLTFGW